MPEQENDEHEVTLDEINLLFDKLTLGGFIVVCLIILQVFVTATPDIAIYISLGSVAIAFPLLVGYFTIITLQEKKILNASGWVTGNMLERVGVGGTLVAIDAAFWHVQWLIGVIFLASTLFATIVYSRYISQNSGLYVKTFDVS